MAMNMGTAASRARAVFMLLGAAFCPAACGPGQSPNSGSVATVTEVYVPFFPAMDVYTDWVARVEIRPRPGGEYSLHVEEVLAGGDLARDITVSTSASYGGPRSGSAILFIGRYEVHYQDIDFSGGSGPGPRIRYEFVRCGLLYAENRVWYSILPNKSGVWILAQDVRSYFQPPEDPLEEVKRKVRVHVSCRESGE